MIYLTALLGAWPAAGLHAGLGRPAPHAVHAPRRALVSLLTFRVPSRCVKDALQF
ncbi:MAG: hypothetical protein IJK42_04850 [Prevotella sp.]|nr:hypothetical protein [Prevotella sp.]